MSKNNPYDDFRKDLGDALRRLRYEKGWSLEESAEYFNIRNPQILDRIERGCSKHFFLTLRLINRYGKKISFSLINMAEESEAHCDNNK